VAAIAGMVGGSIVSGILGGMGGKAQANAAKYAAKLQYQLGTQQLQQNQSQFNTTQANAAPFIKAGQSAIGELSNLVSTPGQGLLTPWNQTFSAPTAAQAQATPGYQFALGAGQGAIQNSAAAGGNLLSTGTLKTLDQYSQGLANTTYSDTYNRAFNEYLTQYNQFQNNQTNTFNRLASVSGLGQQSASTLGQQSNQSSAIGAGIAGTTGAQVGGSVQNAGAATASGYAGIANAVNSGISNINGYNLLQNYLNGPNSVAGGVPQSTSAQLSSIYNDPATAAAFGGGPNI
jgi:hypothetical protein